MTAERLLHQGHLESGQDQSTALEYLLGWVNSSSSIPRADFVHAEASVIRKALFDVSGHIKRVTRGFRNRQSAIQSYDCRDCSKSDDDSPHSVNGKLATFSSGATLSLTLVERVIGLTFERLDNECHQAG